MKIRVSAGDTANFTCGAVGKMINVLWQNASGDLVCDCYSNDCDHRLLCSSRVTSNFESSNDIVQESVLMIINTSLLTGQASELEFSFRCIASLIELNEHETFQATLIVESE